jgi:glycosyltransferase 2 family protein
VKNLGVVLALAGLALAIALFVREGVEPVAELLLAAGPGLVAAAMFHLVPMMLNARAWQVLLPQHERPSLRTLTWGTWIRESVNGLLPVGRIGGEVVAYTILRRAFIRGSAAAASIVADMALSVISQAVFALLGVALLVTLGGSALATPRFVAAAAVMIGLGLIFVLIQRSGAVSAIVSVLNRFLAGRLSTAISKSLRLEGAMREVYARRGDVARCLGWQLAGWVAGAGEIWLALHFLGQGRSVLDAIAIEALIQAISSAAFLVPGALGVQEGGFVVIGAALGLDGTTALALASARRLRDLIVFLPGILAWQRSEFRARFPGRTRPSQTP